MSPIRALITALCLALAFTAETCHVSADRVEWSPDGTYVRVGDPEWGNVYRIYAPTSFIKDLPTELKIRPPDLWGVQHIRYWRASESNTQNTWDIVRIAANGPDVTILLDRHKWIRLNTPRALPIINEIMEGSYHNNLGMPLPVTRMNTRLLESYLSEVEGLYRVDFGRAQVLAPGLWPDTDFSKKETERLTPYSSKPIIMRDAQMINISINFFDQEGAIKKWNFVISPPDSLTITKIRKQVLTPKHLAHYDIPDE